jgi:glucoamylase
VDTVKQSNLITQSLEGHWDAGKGYIVSTTNFGSRKGLDASLVLGVLHTDIRELDDLSFSVLDERVMSTLVNLVASFAPIYTINSVKVDETGAPLAPAIGRYAEDIYDGLGTSRGNPWFLCTAAIGEYLYRVGLHLQLAGRVTVTRINLDFYTKFLGVAVAPGVYDANSSVYASIMNALGNKGDDFMRRVQYHAPTGMLPEEFNRETGVPQGARDLTWSYAAMLTANSSRARFTSLLNKRRV